MVWWGSLHQKRSAAEGIAGSRGIMSSNKSGTFATIRDCQYCCPTASPPPIWSTGSGRQDLIERYVLPAVTGALGDGAFIVYGVNEEKNDLIAVIGERDDSALEITPIQTMGFRSVGVGRISLGHKIPMSY